MIHTNLALVFVHSKDAIVLIDTSICGIYEEIVVTTVGTKIYIDSVDSAKKKS